MSNENDHSRYQPHSESENNTTPFPPGKASFHGSQKPRRQFDSKKLIYILTGVAAVAILAAAFLFMTSHSKQMEQEKKIKEQSNMIGRLEVEKEEMRLSAEFAKIEDQFAQVEDQSVMLQNDSIVEKYAAAKTKIEKLLQELNQEKTVNRARIQQLENEIATLKNILKEYVERIDELTKENESLREENKNVKKDNTQLRANLNEATRSNQELNERMTLAEKLNVTGVDLQSLKKNGKKENNITKAARLLVTFTLPPNNSTPVGEKTIYLRITNPMGDLLPGNGKTFSFEGQTLECTEFTTVEYSGEELGGLKIYWDKGDVMLTPGDYTVELFADNFRIYSRNFEMRK